MKKLLLITLLVISPMTFAKDFDADLLVGKWQCLADSNFDHGRENFKNNAIQTFYKDGTYDSKDVMTTNLDETIKTKVKGKWYIQGNLLKMNIEKVLSFDTDKPNIEYTTEFEKDLNEQKDFVSFVIKDFSKDRLVTHLTKQDQLELNGNTVDICERIK